MITKALFTIDGFNNFYEGYSNKNETWNGWDTPCFENNIVEKIIKLDNNNDHLRFVYDENNDVYIEYDIDNDLTRKYEGYDIEVSGTIKHVYGIGSYIWVWDRYEKDEVENECNIVRS